MINEGAILIAAYWARKSTTERFVEQHRSRK